MLGVASRRAAAAALGGRRLGVRMASTPPQGSLIPQTLREMEVDADFLQTARLLREKGQKRLTLEEKRRRRRALDSLGIPEFEAFLHDRGELDHDEKLRKGTITTLQVNVGLYCNQACSHCHVESSPRRKESMDVATVEHLLAVLNRSPHVHTVDITGGAPEFSAAFRPLVIGATLMGKEVIDRCNLTVLLEPSMAGMAQFLADHRVRVVASLPCYSQRNVDVQRGSNVFDRSITALQMLNDLGYGDPDSGLKLDLVYNPGGPFLPPPQETLRSKYGEELAGSFGIRFNELFTMTNMPIKRFADFLYKQARPPTPPSPTLAPCVGAEARSLARAGGAHQVHAAPCRTVQPEDAPGAHVPLAALREPRRLTIRLRLQSGA